MTAPRKKKRREFDDDEYEPGDYSRDDEELGAEAGAEGSALK